MAPEVEFEGFRIDEVLSRSSTVNVYRAFQYSLKRNVLIKELRPELFREADIRSRFEQEAQLCALLKHENIVDIYDYSTANQRVYLIMEFVDGCSLSECLLRNPSLPIEPILAIILQTLKGLGYAHQQGVIHRDLKPSNILIAKNGWVKITDFGLARFEGAPQVTLPGAVVGTPAYLSPEAIGGGAVTSKSDIFSLGVTFYELLTGQKIFDAEHFSDSLKKVLSYHPPKPSQYRSDLPAELDTAILRMLEKQSNRRWSTCDEVYSAIIKIGETARLGDPKLTLKTLLLQQRQTGVHIGISPTPTSTLSVKRSAKWRIPVTLVFMLIATLVFFYFRSQILSVDKNESVPETHTGDSITTHRQADSIVTNSHPDLSKDTLVGKSEGKSPADTLTSLVSKPNSKSIETGTLAENPKVEQPNKPTPRATVTDSSAGKANPSLALATPAILKIICDPWADVYVDDRFIGKTPFEYIPLSPGMHRLFFQHPSFTPIVRDLTAKAGENVVVDINFWETVGRIVVLVDPWAEVFIDNKFIDTTPLKEPIIVTLGAHTVTLKNPKMNAWEKQIDFTRGAPPCTLRVELKKVEG